MQAATRAVSERAEKRAVTLGPPRLPVRLRYLPGLDGLRAFAVVSVLFYHLDKYRDPWPSAGFLGVEVFFVISGYLITTLLLAEWRNTGRISLKAFYLRRARRLLPALFLTLIATAVLALVFLPDQVVALRGDALAAIGYVSNWWQVYLERSYYEQIGRGPLLEHLWSLAVEEQFYLLWPLMFTSILVLCTKLRWHLVNAFWIVIGGAAISSLLMWRLYAVLYDPGNPSTAANRVYFGTDTRAAGLLIGAALALVWSPWRLTKRTGRGAAALLDLAAIGSLVGLVALMLNITLFELGSVRTLFSGGMLATSLLTAVVIAACAHPASLFGRYVMGNAPMRWIGERSYGIYLWHWPIYIVTRPGDDIDLPAWEVAVLRIGLTVVVSALSFTFVERPVRRGAVGRFLTHLRESRGGERRTLAGNTMLAVCAAGLAVVLLAVGLVTSRPAPAVPGVGPSDGTEAAPLTTTTAPADPGVTTLPPPPPPSFAVGDSVMLGAAATMQEVIPGIVVDAQESRQFGVVYDIVAGLRAAGQLAPVVVIHTGTNGNVDPELFAQLMDMLKDRTRVIVLNLKVPRGWEGPNNDLFNQIVPGYANARLVDWHKIGSEHPEWFYEDGYHLNPEGRTAYAQEILKTINAK